MKFTIIRLWLISALVFLLSGAVVFAGSLENQYLKVGLRSGSSAVATYTVSSSNGFSIGFAENGSFQETLPVAAYTKLVVSLEAGAVVVRAEDGTLVSADLGAKGCIMPMSLQENVFLSIDGKQYRGGAHFFINSSNTLTLINYLTVDDYVKGVLNSEMNHEHPMEALKAQAVAARSFAVLNMDKHVSEGFNLCTGTHCQVYRGYSDEYTETNRAVEETAGMGLYYDGKPVGGYYSKNSGGYTQSASDVWGSKHGYLIGKKDPYSPDYPWTATFTFDQLSTQLAAARFNVGQVNSVSITERNASGAVKTIVFSGSGGTAKLQKEQMRTVFGYSVIKSTMFSMTGASTGTGTGNGNGQTDGQISKDLYFSNGTSSAKNIATVSVLAADGTPVQVKLEQLYVTDGTSTGKAGATVGSGTGTSEPIATTETLNQSPVTFVGKGYGHGVGMSQDGAIEMAKQSFTYEQILKYYYTNIEIR